MAHSSSSLMSHPANIKKMLAEGQIVRVMAFGPLASPKLVELAGLVGDLHGIWVDQEHTATPHQQMEELLRACRSVGLDSFARVAPTDYTAIMRPMEAGASGVMVAQIRSIEQTRQVIQWAKYPPRGIRGLYQGNIEAGYGTRDVQKFIEEANRDRWLCIQVETPEAVENIDGIAALAEVDYLFVGPSDLACTLGVPGQVMHPKCIEALERVSAASKTHGKPWGVLARSAEHAAKCRELGCQLFSLAGDLDIAHRGFQATKKLYAEFFGKE